MNRHRTAILGTLAAALAGLAAFLVVDNADASTSGAAVRTSIEQPVVPAPVNDAVGKLPHCLLCMDLS